VPTHVQTGLQCLIAIARHYGTDLSTEYLTHAYTIGEEAVSPDLLLRMVRESGFRARKVSISWSQLLKLDGAFPVLAHLTNSNWVIVSSIDEGSDQSKILVPDPMDALPEPMALTEAGFCGNWNGEITLVKPNRIRLTEYKRPFGFLWFATELLRQRCLLRDVVLAALVLYGLGLAVPIFSQLVIDKVLVHET
jgi:ATP-binding cassette, subfamily B, bacterial HlyB/CyaB